MPHSARSLVPAHRCRFLTFSAKDSHFLMCELACRSLRRCRITKLANCHADEAGPASARGPGAFACCGKRDSCDNHARRLVVGSTYRPRLTRALPETTRRRAIAHHSRIATRFAPAWRPPLPSVPLYSFVASYRALPYGLTSNGVAS